MSNSTERDQSEFNMAISYLNRLNYLFYMCDAASMDLNVHRWYHILLTLFRELSTEMTETEVKEQEAESAKINELVTLYISRPEKALMGIPPDLYKRLHTFELFIRKVCKSSGLQNKMKDDPRNALR